VKLFACIARFFCVIAWLGILPCGGHAQSAPDFKVYVTLPNSNSVAIVDGLTNTVVTTVAVPPGAGTAPYSVALTPDARFAYVVNSQLCNDGATFGYNETEGVNPVQGFVWVLDTATNNTAAVIPVDLCPEEIAITPDGTRAYVTNFGSNTLSAIDTASNTVLQSISLPDSPDGLAITPDGSSVYVATNLAITVVSTATNSVTATISTPISDCSLSELAVTPNGQQVYVTSEVCSSAFIVSTQTNSFVFSFPAQSFSLPWGIATTPDGKEVYLASYNGEFDFSSVGETFAIDTSTLNFTPHPMCGDTSIPSACVQQFGTEILEPVFVEITPDGKEAYFSSNSNSPVTGELMVFDITNNVSTASVPFSTVPAGIAISPANNTPAGMNAVVQPVDQTTKTLPVTVTFSDVTQPGFTSLITSSTGPTPPSGFEVAGVYYNLATTAQFTGNTTICITSPAVTSISLLEHFGSGGPSNITSSVNPPSICGVTTSLSPFAILQAASSTGGATSTTLTSSADPSVYGQMVTFTAEVSASAGSPTGSVSFSDGSTTLATSALNAADVAMLSTSTLRAGTHVITASYSGDSNFTSSASPAVTQTVNPAPLNVIANSFTRQYGQANPAFTVSYSGFVNGDSSAVLSGALSCVSSATPSSSVGTYAINCSGLSSPNYLITNVPGTLTITPAPLTITAYNASRVYGTANPTLSATYAGFLNGDTAAALSGALSCASPAMVSSPVGSYPINCGGVSSSNYAITFVPGALTVTPAALTIVANNATRVYGAANPTLAASYAGFVNGDTPSVLLGALSCSTAATPASPVGSYSIICGGQTAANYSISYLPGQLTVTPAILTITANNLTKAFDAPNPTLTWTASGFVNGDTTSVLTTLPTCTTTATTTSPVGSYPITCSGAAAANYALSYVPGTLTVACHYISIGLSPSTVAEGDWITVSWTLRSCSNATQTVAFDFALSGPAQPDSCSATKSEMFALPPFPLQPNTLQTWSFPFRVPKRSCPGTYTTTATTTISVQAVDTSSTSLTITAP
jgi:YVTN family beta-propeller protein